MIRPIVALLALVYFILPAAADEKEWLKAKALKPGDTIALVFPAGPMDITPVKQYAERMRKAGYKVLMTDKERRNNYLAGTDDERANELNAALRDPNVNAIFACRGGYGLTRILDRLDYEAIRKNPKIVTGYSDLTALHLAIAKHAKVITFHATMGDIFNPANDNIYAVTTWRRALFADQYPKGTVGYTVTVPKEHTPVKVVGGKGLGRLMGGNLTLVCSTLGTPYAIEPKGAILLIEDVNEAPYRVDRSLSQLRLAGVLDKISGVVIGGFTTKEPAEQEEIKRVLLEYFGKQKYPVIMNFPVGHITLNGTLPHGAMMELDGDKATLKVLENPVLLNRK
jgi:muramoyltetrapeptide carboxypeptidase